MNASTFLIPTVAVIALVGIMGAAHAQTGTMSSETPKDNVANPPSFNCSSSSTGTINRDSTGTTGRNSNDNMKRSSTGDRSNERIARADRN